MEATPEQAAEGQLIVQVLSAVLDRLVSVNAPIARVDPGAVTKFHAMRPPNITIQSYLERIHKYACCSNECFVLALIYVDRLIQRNNVLLTDLNVHRVIITAVLLAAKFFDDAYYNNAYYAKVGGVLVSEINGLEVDLLFRINFSLHVTPDEFEKYRVELLSRSIQTQQTPMETSSLQYQSSAVQVSPEVAPVLDPAASVLCQTEYDALFASTPPAHHAETSAAACAVHVNHNNHNLDNVVDNNNSMLCVIMPPAPEFPPFMHDNTHHHHHGMPSVTQRKYSPMPMPPRSHLVVGGSLPFQPRFVVDPSLAYYDHHMTTTTSLASSDPLHHHRHHLPGGIRPLQATLVHHQHGTTSSSTPAFLPTTKGSPNSNTFVHMLAGGAGL